MIQDAESLCVAACSKVDLQYNEHPRASPLDRGYLQIARPLRFYAETTNRLEKIQNT